MVRTAKEFLTLLMAIGTYYSGLASVARRLSKSKIAILTYHSVGPTKAHAPSCLELSGMRVSLPEFRKQMQYVANHYNTVTMEEVITSILGKSVLPSHPCVVTFDDGYLDVYENAVPVLEELGLKATLYVMGRATATGEAPWLHALYGILDTMPLTDCASAFHKAAPEFFSGADVGKNEFCRQIWKYFRERDRSVRTRFLEDVRVTLGRNLRSDYRFLEDRHIRELRTKGFEIGCHSMDHEYMSSLRGDELGSDICRCSEVLGSILNGAPHLFSYPFGGRDSFDPRVIDALKKAGFTCSCTTVDGVNDRSTNPFMLYRIGVYTETTFPLFVFRLVGLQARSRKVYTLFNNLLPAPRIRSPKNLER